MADSKNTIDLDSLDILDVDMSDVEDLPSFDCPPNGTYKMLLSAEGKQFEGKEGKPDSTAVSFDYEIIEVVELADKAADPTTVVAGSKFNELFGLSSEDGIKYLKKALLPYSDHFGTTKIKELVKDKIQNLVIVATVKARVVTKDKEGNKLDEPKRFASVINVTLA